MSSEGERERFAALERAFKDAVEHTTDGVFGQISTLWKGLFEDRRNFPTYDQFAVGLRHDANFAVGIGMGVRTPPDEATYARQFASWVERVVDQFPAEELARWPEPALGSPTIIEHAGYRASALYIKNFAQAHVLMSRLHKHGRRTSGLKVLEIGAGYGGVAEILLRMGVAARCTIVDLPNNLFLAAQFLSLNFTERSAAICDRANPSAFKSADLRFVLPNEIEFLDDEEFDLVINAASLGEMPAAAAQAYVAWVSRHLSDDGFFISHNADRVKNQPDVVQRHSEYGYQQFHFEAVYPNTAAGGPLHIQHLILVLSKSRGLQPDFDWAVLDRLGWLLNLGLNHEVEKVCNFVNTPGDKLGEIFLDIVERFYRASTLPEKYAVASTRTGDAACDLILEFLQGGAAFLQNDPTAYGHLFKYLSASRSPMAIALGLLTVRLWSGGAFDAAQQQVVIDAWAKVPVYVREQLDGLRLAAAQVRFATYMRLM